MVDPGRVDDPGCVLEPLAVEGRCGHVQRLVVEGVGEGALLEVAADDRHRVDRRDRRDAQAAERGDQPAARGVGERKVVDRGGEDVGDLLGDQLLGRRHADVDRLAQAADRRGGLLAERSVRLVADHELVGGARDLVDVTGEPGVGLDRDRVRPRDLVPGEDHVGEALAVTVVGELAPELVDEQAAVGQDQHAFGACGLDEAGGRDRLAGGGRVAEAVAPLCTRVLVGRRREVVGLAVVVELDGDVVLVLLLFLDELLGGDGAVGRPVAVAVLLLDRGDQLGEHPGERVHLVAAQLGAGGEARRLLGEDALEPEHERVAHLPLGRGGLQPGVHLHDRVVERAAYRRARPQRGGGVVVGAKEGLSGPCFGPKGRGSDAFGRLPVVRRFDERLVHGRDTILVPPLQV